MAQGDKTGPNGEGPETGRGQGVAAGNPSGQSSNEGRPYDGQGGGQGNRTNYGPGTNNTKTYNPRENRNLQKQDGSGPPSGGRELGPGKGKMDCSGLEDIVVNTKNIEKYFSPNNKSYDSVSKEYSPIYSENKGNYSNSDNLKAKILEYHNEAVGKKHNLKGSERREYVRKKMREYSKKNPKKSSGKTYTGKKTSTKKAA